MPNSSDITPAPTPDPGAFAAVPDALESVSFNAAKFALSSRICSGSMLSDISIFSEAKNERKQPIKTVF